MDAVMFNPSGDKTATFLRFTGQVSVFNEVTFITTLNTIPYHLYSQDSMETRLQVFAQILLLILAYKFFVTPFYAAMFGEPPLIDTAADCNPQEIASIKERNVVK